MNNYIKLLQREKSGYEEVISLAMTGARKERETTNSKNIHESKMEAITFILVVCEILINE